MLTGIIISKLLHSCVNFIHFCLQSLFLFFVVLNFNFCYSALVFHKFNLMLLAFQLVFNILQLASQPLRDLLFLSYTYL